jgi:hypothetical protein
MALFLDEALEWLDRAEQAREVAGLLTDPGAARPPSLLAANFERLARGATVPIAERRKERAQDQEKNP